MRFVQLFIFFTWLNTLISTKCFKKGLPFGFRIQHILFSLLFFGLNSSIPTIGWFLFSFDDKASEIFFPVAFIPAVIIGSIKILSIVVDLVFFFSTLSLMKGNEKGRKLFIRLLPLSVLISPISSLIGANRNSPLTSNEAVGFLIFFSISSLLFHFWVYKFYSSSKNKNYLEFGQNVEVIDKAKGVIDVMILADFEFEEVVEEIGKALTLKFSKDESGIFGEYESYLADAKDVSYAVISVDSKTQFPLVYQIKINSGESEYDLAEFRRKIDIPGVEIHKEIFA